ncbi:arabinogalactan endo-1,4-beta-galactosidase [Paenibacillus spiritus]|uniref:Arabinogalactan endo-beta-1,4-galactanase n=1 Tax=Paenibacillus spiritus TaxID=2496557 RepID=A0A5J5GBW1_9BACL|nr:MULTISPECIES: glycosyl hydrolase 53 family protein [Paenibacillus]KAA9005440.1 arabinogalactan endo-1,4-beta-galactosidase [Paenibacillus spiritus]
MSLAVKKKGAALIALLAIALVLASLSGAGMKRADAAPAFAKGADISWVAGLEAQGYTWKDKNGKVRDIFDILKNDYQINSARIRVWVNPNMSDYANGYMNAEKAAALAKRAKAAGMSVMLTLHYSDSWADPGQQTKPYAWQSFNFTQLMDAVYSHTVYVMNTMKNAGVTPDWVQIGNETNNGMLWEDGKATVSMKNYAWLVNTGNNAVKSVFSSTKTIVHIAGGNDNALFVWNIGGLLANGATFDYIGMSLYPSTSDWSAKVDQTISNANDLINRYGKSVMICEIGLDYSQPAIAKNFVSTIKTKVRNISGGKGLGVFYWEPESPPNYNGGYKLGAWGADGKPTAALEGFLN